MFLFFQAEDGIRDLTVTGVQTCALPIWTVTSSPLSNRISDRFPVSPPALAGDPTRSMRTAPDRKSTRLNSSHSQISYAVFCLKKKKNTPPTHHARHKTDHNIYLHSVHDT